MNDDKTTRVVGYVSEANPFTDKTAWSGLIYKIRESIEHAGCKVVWIKCRPHGKLSKLCKMWNEYLHGKSTMYEHTKANFRLRAWSIDRQQTEQCDLLFFPTGAQVVNFLNSKKPVIYYSDTTFKLMCGYYWPQLTPWQYATGQQLEAGAIARSSINLRASQWAADSVVREYGFAPSHTYVLRFGANLDDADIVPITPYQGDGQQLNILFSGVDWKRKGAETAIGTVEELNNRGIPARLFIVGIRELPERFHDHPYIEFVGYLNKSNPEEYKRYVEVVSNCHLFLLPTRAECAGIVFGEASAYGMPIFTYDTGGIADYVFQGVNGYRLPMSAGPKDFADKIQSTLTREQQGVLHDGCLKVYKEMLNWGVWSREFRKILEAEF